MEIKDFTFRNILNSADNISNCQEFMTSLNIIQEVMGIPMLAVKCMLRQAGDDEIDPSSYCIDEKQLELFADAYIRKMKNYFISSVRNISIISHEEKADLTRFYELFKNEDAKSINSAKWCQINIEHLRSVFMDKIKRLTEEKRDKRYASIDELLEFIVAGFESVRGDLKSHCLMLDIVEKSTNNSQEEVTIRIGDNDYPITDIFPSSLYFYFHQYYWNNNVQIHLNEYEEVLTSISEKSITYHSPKINYSKRIKINCPQVNNILRKIYIAARYHIFAADDNNPYSLVA